MAEFFISPTGNDANPGTSASRFKTWGKLFSVLGPGDKGIAGDGTYTHAENGPFLLNAANSVDGTQATPIIIEAENERKALLDLNGAQYGVEVRDRQWWEFHGFRIKSVDNENGNNRSLVHLGDSNNIVFSRCLLHNNNRYFNTALIRAIDCEDTLFLETECYFFHRHAGVATRCKRITVRRCYANSRGHGNIEGGYQSGNADGGEELFSFYPAQDSIIENCIAEDMEGINETNGTGAGGIGVKGNKVLGSIALNCGLRSLSPNCRGTTEFHMPEVLHENVLLLNNSKNATRDMSSKGSNYRNVTIWNGADRGIWAQLYPTASRIGDGEPVVYVENSLIVGCGTQGLRFESIHGGHVKHTNAFDCGTNFQFLSSPNVVQEGNMSVDPEITTLRPWLPLTSPMKGAGIEGSDIGANIIFRYENGELTDVPLWDPNTGEFPHGAIIEGVNDVAGKSAFDVHDRLNVTPAALAEVLGDPPQDPEGDNDVDYTTVVDTVPDSLDAVGRGYQTPIGWVTQELLWAFYSDGTNAAWRTKQIGAGGEWSAKQTLIAGLAQTALFDVALGPTGHFHISYIENGDVKYLRGMPDGNGDIAMDAAVTAWTDATWNAHTEFGGNRHSIMVDDAGHVWITFQATDGTNQKPIALSNVATDGTWTSRSGWPKDLDTQDAGATHGTSPHSLLVEAGKILFSWTDVANNRMSARLWERGDPATAEGTLGGIENTGLTPTGAVHRSNALPVGTGEALLQAYGSRVAHRASNGTWTEVSPSEFTPSNFGGLSKRDETVRFWRHTSGEMRYVRTDDNGTSWSQQITKHTGAVSISRNNAGYLPSSDLNGHVATWQNANGEIVLLLEGEVVIPVPEPPPELIKKKWSKGPNPRSMKGR